MVILPIRPADKADDCLRDLHELGYARVAIIGQVKPKAEALEPITLIK